MRIRKYQPSDAPELRRLFFDTVHQINIRDYSPEQVAAWAPENYDIAAWQNRLKANDPWVCESDGIVVGFADLQSTGYIDQFYVHHLWQGRGVGRQLMTTLLAAAKQQQIAQLWSNVSITAKPFFTHFGFVIAAQQQVAISGISFTNFRMTKQVLFH